MVSVIVPVYNAEAFLTDCIDSILCQIYKDFELILVDDGSTDRSGMICDYFAAKDKRVKVIRKANGGVSKARNTGLEAAQGDYIAFCDCDDQYDLDYLSWMVDALQKNKADMAVCNYYYKTGHICNAPFSGGFSRIISIEDLYQRIFLSNEIGGFVWNKLFRRELLEGVRFQEDMKICEDTHFVTAAALKAEKIFYLCKPLYYYSIREDSAVGQIENLISMKHTSKYTDAYLRLMKDFQLSEQMIQYVRCGIYRLAVHLKCDYQIAGGRDRPFKASLDRDIKEHQKYYLQEKSISSNVKLRTLANSRFNLRRFKRRRTC